jgi:hypothetical protein
MNNATTARRPLRFNEHSGIIAAQIKGVPYVGPNVDAINKLPQGINIPAFGPIRR